MRTVAVTFVLDYITKDSVLSAEDYDVLGLAVNSALRIPRWKQWLIGLGILAKQAQDVLGPRVVFRAYTTPPPCNQHILHGRQTKDVAYTSNAINSSCELCRT